MFKFKHNITAKCMLLITIIIINNLNNNFLSLSVYVEKIYVLFILFMN